MPRKKPIRLMRAGPRPAVGKNQRPLETVAEARRQIVAVKRNFAGGKAKFVAFTNLLSRACAGKTPNRDVIRLISAERDRIRISSVKKEKPFEKKLVPKKKLLFGNTLDATDIHLRSLEMQLGKGNFKRGKELIHILLSDTPLSDAAIVANRLHLLATEQGAEYSKQGVKDPVFSGTVTMLYAAAGELFRQKGMLNRANEMFSAADAFKARAE